MNDECEEESSLPPNVLLNDESLLDAVHPAENDASSSNIKLSSITLACMLAFGTYERKVQASDKLMDEKCSTYLDKVWNFFDAYCSSREFYVNTVFLYLNKIFIFIRVEVNF